MCAICTCTRDLAQPTVAILWVAMKRAHPCSDDGQAPGNETNDTNHVWLAVSQSGTPMIMAVGSARGEGGKKTYPIYVLWVCAAEGGKLLLLDEKEMLVPASEMLATYSYSPLTRRATLLGHASVHGLVRGSETQKSQCKSNGRFQRWGLLPLRACVGA